MYITTSIPIDFSDSESTVVVEMEPTTLEIARTEIVQRLEIRVRDLKMRNRDLNEVSCERRGQGTFWDTPDVNVQAGKFWRAEASKLADYVELGKYATGCLRSEVDNLNARIRNLDDVSISRQFDRRF